jgi:hypothetical protein
MKAYRVLMVAGAMLAGVMPFLAQAMRLHLQDDEVLPVTPGAGAYLPAPEDLGADWISTVQAGIAPGPELFSEGVKGVYGGPGGARAVVYVWLTRDEAATARRSWEAIAEFMGSVRNEWGSVYDPAQESELALLPPPAGCVEASRTAGIAAGTQYPVGLTLCAVEPDVILLTIVSGEFDGEAGHLASDALIGTALEVAAAAD